MRQTYAEPDTYFSFVVQEDSRNGGGLDVGWLEGGTCFCGAAAQEAGLANLLLQLPLQRAQLGKLCTCLALKSMLLCLHAHGCASAHCSALMA